MSKRQVVPQYDLETLRAERGDVSSVKVGARSLTRGDVVTIVNERGTFTFYTARVVDGECRWVTVFGGPVNRQCWRHFDPARIKSKKRVKADERAAS